MTKGGRKASTAPIIHCPIYNSGSQDAHLRKPKVHHRDMGDHHAPTPQKRQSQRHDQRFAPQKQGQRLPRYPLVIVLEQHPLVVHLRLLPRLVQRDRDNNHGQQIDTEEVIDHGVLELPFRRLHYLYFVPFEVAYVAGDGEEQGGGVDEQGDGNLEHLGALHHVEQSQALEEEDHRLERLEDHPSVRLEGLQGRRRQGAAVGGRISSGVRRGNLGRAGGG